MAVFNTCQTTCDVSPYRRIGNWGFAILVNKCIRNIEIAKRDIAIQSQSLMQDHTRTVDHSSVRNFGIGWKEYEGNERSKVSKSRRYQDRPFEGQVSEIRSESAYFQSGNQSSQGQKKQDIGRLEILTQSGPSI
jgi:hypothetical protein